MKYFYFIQILGIILSIIFLVDAIKLEKVYKKKRKPTCKEDIDKIEKNYNSQLQVLDEKIDLNVGDIIHCEVIVKDIDLKDTKLFKKHEIKVINTPDSTQYQYFPVATENQCFTFQVRASNDAYISLNSMPISTELNYEFIIGCSDDFQRVSIKKNATELIGKDISPNLLNIDEFHGFWISWQFGFLQIGAQSETEPLISFEDANMIPINFMGIRTVNGSSGVWIIEEPKCPPPKGKYGKIKQIILGTKCWTPDVTEDNLSWSDES